MFRISIFCLAPHPNNPIYITKFSEIVRKTACGCKNFEIFMFLKKKKTCMSNYINSNCINYETR